MLAKFGARLETQLGLAWPGSSLVGERNSFVWGRFGSSQISSDLDSAGFGSVLGIWLGSSLS